MDWPERMTAALDYLETNLDGDIDIAEAARRAACSPFYFQRLFAIVTGMTAGEYVRKRRLTLAASDLTSGDLKVIDVALRYGYDSPDAFTRAFRAMHGITPQAAREPGTSLVACPRISFRIALKGDTDMNYRIVETPTFQVAITKRQFINDDGQKLKDIPAWWQEFLVSPDCQKLRDTAGNKPGRHTGSTMLGVCYEDSGVGNFYYGIAVELPEGASARKFETVEIPATTWAVFQCRLGNLQEVTRQVFWTWYEATGYDNPGTPDLEVYLPGEEGPGMKCEIWAPVIRK